MEGHGTYSSKNCNAIIDSLGTLVVGCKNTIIPDNIRKIESEAFSSCTGLKSLKLPESVWLIGAFTFENCINLETLEIGNKVELIGDFAFQNCNKLIIITNNPVVIEYCEENHIKYKNK